MPLKIVSHRRRRDGRTDYRKRLKLLKNKGFRFVVRKSLKNMYCQIIEYKKNGDCVTVSSDSRELAKFGWTANTGNLPAAYLTGLLCGLRAKNKNIPSAIMDNGLYTSVHGSRLYAAFKGAVDGGLEMQDAGDAIPSEERISGKHIADYAAKMKKEKPVAYKTYFSGYLNSKVSPEDLPKLFETTKGKILSEGK